MALPMAGLFSVFINLLMLASPLYLMNVYDRVLTSNSQQTLIALTLVALGCFALYGLLDWTRQRILSRAAARYSEKVGNQLAAQSIESSDSRALSQLEQVRSLLNSPVAGALFDLPLVPIYLIFTAFIHPLLCVLTLVGAAFLLLLAILAQKISDKPSAQAQTATLRALQEIDHARILGDALKVLGMQEAVQQRWNDKSNEASKALDDAAARAGFFSSLVKLARMILQVALIATGAYLVLQGNLTAGAIFAVSIISARGLQPIEVLVGGWRQLNHGRSAYKALSAMEFEQKASSFSLPAPDGTIELEQVSLMLEGQKEPMFSNIDLKLAKGEVTVLVGPSGSGKSTLMRMMIGALPPSTGHIRLSGATLDQWPPNELGKHLGYLSQDTHFTRATVAQSIARLNDGAKDTDIIEAAQKASAHDMILRLSEGYETPIGPGSHSVSGGQKQQIALARAFYGNPPLLLLDEPNAHLDSTSEKGLHDAIMKAKADRQSVVLISQRAGILPLADRILLVRDGQIADVTEQTRAQTGVARTSPTVSDNDATDGTVIKLKEPAQ